MGGHRVGQAKANLEEAAGKKKFRKDEKPALAQNQSFAEKLSRPVSSLKLKGLYHNSARVCISQLEKNGVKTLGDLVKLGEENLMRMRYARGDQFRKALKKELAGIGLGLGMEKKPEETLALNLAKRVCALEDACSRYNGRYFNLSGRLQQNGINLIFELVEKTEDELRGMKEMGPKSLYVIKRGLADMGLSLGMKLDEKRLVEVKGLQEKDGWLGEQDMPRVLSRIQRAEQERYQILSQPWAMDWPAGSALLNSDIRYMFELVTKTEEELLAVRKIGKARLGKIEKMLEGRGLSLGMKMDEKTMEGLKGLSKKIEDSHSRKDVQARLERIAKKQDVNTKTMGTWGTVGKAAQAATAQVQLATPPMIGLPLAPGTAIMVKRPMEKFTVLVDGACVELKALRGLVRPQNVESLGKLLDYFRMLPFAEAAASHGGFVGMGVEGNGKKHLVYATAVMVTRPMEDFKVLLEKSMEEHQRLKRLVQPRAIESMSGLLDIFYSP